MLLFSDVHLREDSADIVLGEVLPGILEACMKSGENELACLGDFYHFRYRIDVRIQNEVRAWLKRVTRSGIHVLILPGNHDQVDFDGRNALEVFDDVHGVEVFTEPTWTTHGLWVPYRKRPEDIQKALTLAIPQGLVPKRVLFMHHGVQGAMMNNLLQDTEGLPQAMFAGWPRILCGHYHKRQELGPLTYIGSPWQTKADEAGQPKGYAHWDGTTLRFVDTAWGPRYHRFELKTSMDTLSLEGVTARDVVRVTTAPGIDPEKVGAFLAEHNVRATVTPEVKVAEARIALPDGASLDSYAAEYVRMAETPLDKMKLLETFREVVGL